ncbi:hypothetical protein OK016_26390 [Vibrio chagasii]|nr:hypothetical protein [Vibrio chagasii]
MLWLWPRVFDDVLKKIKEFLDKKGVPATTFNSAITDYKSHLGFIRTSLLLRLRWLKRLPTYLRVKQQLAVKNMIMVKTLVMS